MANKKVDTLIKRIDAALVELCELLDLEHISAYIINGNVMITDYTDLSNKQINYYRGANNE